MTNDMQRQFDEMVERFGVFGEMRESFQDFVERVSDDAFMRGQQNMQETCE